MADSPTRYAVLGLLSFARQSGYDLSRVAERSIAGFWPISKTHVYAELRRLEADGLVEGRAALSSGGPERRIYELTPDGELALDAWLQAGTVEPMRLRAPTLLRVLLGHRARPATTRRLLTEYGRRNDDRLQELREVAARLAGNPDAVYAWATAQFGVRLCEAIAGWVDEVAERLPETSPQIDPRRAAPTEAAALLAALQQR